MLLHLICSLFILARLILLLQLNSNLKVEPLIESGFPINKPDLIKNTGKILVRIYLPTQFYRETLVKLKLPYTIVSVKPILILETFFESLDQLERLLGKDLHYIILSDAV